MKANLIARIAVLSTVPVSLAYDNLGLAITAVVIFMCLAEADLSRRIDSIKGQSR